MARLAGVASKGDVRLEKQEEKRRPRLVRPEGKEEADCGAATS